MNGGAIVEIDGDKIGNWDGFHTEFSEVLGFPDFYGRNGNAWIDCMTDVDDAGDTMTQIKVPPGKILTLQIANSNALKRFNPEMLGALNDLVAFVNWRRIEQGEQPVLALSYSASGD
ncbi:MAG: barstar family protein [Pseudomonadota bacterium]